MSAIVSVSDLKKTYKDGLIRRKYVEALRGVSFEVQPGEIFGLLGPNGAGKTTLIKILLGIVRRSGGDAMVLDRAVGDRRGRERIGYLPEHHRIPRHLTGYSALEYYGQLSNLPISEIVDKRDALLRSVGLGEWGTHGVKGYSKGMLQRLGLAQAMLHDPELLVLDEPTDGVDPIGRADIRETLFRLKEQGRTVIINSHLLHEIELVCDRVAILLKGRARFVGRIHELTESDASNPVIVLSGEEDTVRRTVEPFEPASVESRGGRSFAVELKFREQSRIDQLVDAVSTAGLSIVSLTRDSLTLEKAFLQLVEESENAEAAANRLA